MLDTRFGDTNFGPDGASAYENYFEIGNISVSDGNTTVINHSIPRGIQIWTVQIPGRYKLLAAGASGSDQYSNARGGRGVVAATEHILAAGDVVLVLVGQTDHRTNRLFAGGGGGTFITRFLGPGSFAAATSHQPILVAGGGGGAGLVPDRNGVDGTTGTAGTLGRCGIGTAARNGGGGGGGGLAGGDGGKGTDPPPDESSGIAIGAGGGGFSGDGGDGYMMTQGRSFLNGGAGGLNGFISSGFGGGGGGYDGGGGGGGYSGGGGCPNLPCPSAAPFGCVTRQGGGGGGSFDIAGPGGAATLYAAWNASELGPAPAGFDAGWNRGDGFAVLRYVGNSALCAAPTPSAAAAGALPFSPSRARFPALLSCQPR
jgi:hypothetical protein